MDNMSTASTSTASSIVSNDTSTKLKRVGSGYFWDNEGVSTAVSPSPASNGVVIVTALSRADSHMDDDWFSDEDGPGGHETIV